MNSSSSRRDSASNQLSKEIRYRDKFHKAIKANYNQIINDLVQNPENLKYFIDELFKEGAMEGLTRQELMDIPSRQQRAEKLFTHVALSSATTIRKFIILFEKTSQNLYQSLITDDAIQEGLLEMPKARSVSCHRINIEGEKKQAVVERVQSQVQSECSHCKLLQQQVNTISMDNEKLKARLDLLESKFKKFLLYQNQFTETQFMKIANIEAKLNV